MREKERELQQRLESNQQQRRKAAKAEGTIKRYIMRNENSFSLLKKNYWQNICLARADALLAPAAWQKKMSSRHQPSVLHIILRFRAAGLS